MADILMTPPRPSLRLYLSGRRMGVAVLIGSTALHVAVFIALAMRVVDPPDRGMPTSVLDWPVYVQLEPTPRIEGRSRPTSPPSSTLASADAPAILPPPASLGAPPAVLPASNPADAAEDRARSSDPSLEARIARSLRRGVAGCRMMAGRLDSVEQARCDRLFAQAAAQATPIDGTGDPVRDARFAAAGAQALVDYERRRASLKPNSRADPCPHGSDIMGGCPVRVFVPLWSSTDGFLPGLKRDD